MRGTDGTAPWRGPFRRQLTWRAVSPRGWSSRTKDLASMVTGPVSAALALTAPSRRAAGPGTTQYDLRLFGGKRGRQGRTSGKPAAEVGYSTAARARGRGAASRAPEALTGRAFESFEADGLERLGLLHQVDDLASCRVAQKNRYDFPTLLPAAPSPGGAARVRPSASSGPLPKARASRHHPPGAPWRHGRRVCRCACLS